MDIYRVLLVDSDPYVLTMVGLGLMKEGHRVTLASSPETAVNALNSKEFDFVVTLDDNMAIPHGSLSHCVLR